MVLIEFVLEASSIIIAAMTLTMDKQDMDATFIYALAGWGLIMCAPLVLFTAFKILHLIWTILKDHVCTGCSWQIEKC